MFYHYKGSLTIPPCAETVERFVITDIFEISRKNYEKIEATINGGNLNAKQVQPLNGRGLIILGRFCDL
jgi:carbonic anhydrase